MPEAWTDKDERQYEEIKKQQKAQGKSTDRAEEIAARTVNKRRRKVGQKTPPGERVIRTPGWRIAPKS